MKAAQTTLQKKIHQSMPLSLAMGYQIVELDDLHIIVEAPLQPNINIHGTAFAGSIYSVGVLSAWALVYHVILKQGLDADLVISRAVIEYLSPVHGTIRCNCRLEIDQMQRFIDELVVSRRSRIEAVVNIGERPDAELLLGLHASLKK
jgi:thioesterase domain-containing protein